MCSRKQTKHFERKTYDTLDEEDSDYITIYFMRPAVKCTSNIFL